MSATLPIISECVLAGMRPDQIQRFMAEKHPDLHLDASQTEALIHQAHKALAKSARVVIKREVGKALARLENLYARSLTINDFKGCLAIEKERIKLLRLVDAAGARAVAADVEVETLRRQVECISGYLRPLSLVAESYPLEEHARVAAELIRRGRETRA